MDATTLYGKMIMGYQGWFSCPGDAGGRGWVHWMNGAHQPTVDLLPDVSELSPDERCDSGWKDAAGKPVFLFSDQNGKTVDRHFQWMEQYGIDGVALQRFATGLRDAVVRRNLDTTLANVRAGAARHGRVWMLMYDLSGMPPEQYQMIVNDWKGLLAAGVARDAGYQTHKGRAVLGLWGIGFAGRPQTPADAQKLIADLRAETPGGLTILGGTPTYWREGKADASPDPGWAKVWPTIDVISPWTVGRYRDDTGARAYADNVLKPDIIRANEYSVDLMPVAFPGFTWLNLMLARGDAANTVANQIPRRCGAFYWGQALNATKAGSRMLYTAMFDEVDEGTAMFKTAPDKSASPANPSFVTLDADGCHDPSDFYLRLGGRATKLVRASGGK